MKDNTLAFSGKIRQIEVHQMTSKPHGFWFNRMIKKFHPVKVTLSLIGRTQGKGRYAFFDYACHKR